jgi:sporulation protein YlmC with PRC-barrel domain
MIRLSDLRDKKIRTLDGDTLGRVHEVHCDKGQIIALMCGPGSFIERLTARRDGSLGSACAK